jgi:GNAT superfamily N-acetyltransferase
MTDNAGFSLHRFTPDQWETLKAIRLEALREDAPVFGNSHQIEAAWSDDDWQKKLADPANAYWGFYQGETLIGLTSVLGHEEEAATAWLTASYIQRPWRRKGLADLLYGVRIDWARQKGLKRLIACHRASNEATKAALRKFGFSYTHTIHRVWGDGTSADNLFYELRLEPETRTTTDRYRLERFVPSQWKEFKDFRLEALRQEPGVFGSNYAREVAFSDQQWKDRLENPRSAYWGLYDGPDLVGMTGIFAPGEDPEEAELIASYIRSPYRRKGLSALFYEARIHWAREQGFKRLIISHRASNLSSKAANQKFGFRYTYTEDRTWADGSREDNIFYQLEL